MMWLRTFTVWLTLNVAVADRLLFMVTVHLPALPLQAPLQPAKYEPLIADAVINTLLPAAKEAWQVGLQLIPDGVLVTVPLPVPAKVIVKVYVVGGAVASCGAAPEPAGSERLFTLRNARQISRRMVLWTREMDLIT
jgi:hypothetical protein